MGGKMDWGKSKTIWLVIIIVLSLVGCTVADFLLPSRVVNMRAIDWEKFVENDPHLQHPLTRDQDIEQLQDFYGPYIEILVDGWKHPIFGHVLSRQVFFVDLSGDGQEEAVVRLNCGGCNGEDHGVLIYAARNGMPVLVGVLGGIDVVTRVDTNSLVFREPIYDFGNSHCCPSGWSTTHYRLVQDRMVAVEHFYELHPESRWVIAESFYSELENKYYRNAYVLLSQAFQAANPYEPWRLQYQNTTLLNYKVDELADGSIHVDYTQTVLTTSGEITHHYSGKWSFVATPNGWRMENPEFKQVD
jgi:hypothetical protein